jgi:ABC-type antimicrobial peptide transport system permease subunit
MPSSLSALTLIQVIIICICIGVLSVLFPAFRAANIDTVKALRD